MPIWIIWEPEVKKRTENWLTVVNEPYQACEEAHAIAVLTEWDEFKTYDWEKIYECMLKPAFVFDGRDILDTQKLTEIGFNLSSIGKPKIKAATKEASMSCIIS